MSWATLAMTLFFNDTATTEVYTLSLHDLFRSPGGMAQGARRRRRARQHGVEGLPRPQGPRRLRHRPLGLARRVDRKSTRLNSSHSQISYAVFCLKKKKTNRDLPLKMIVHSHPD